MLPLQVGPKTHDAATGTGPVSLGNVLLSFLKIGSIGFGGGMAMIALMEKEFVRRRELIPPEEFVHSVGLGQALGAFAVNVSVFIGYRLFGAAGALLCAGAFLSPSVVLIIVLSSLYFRYHAVPELRGVVAGLTPVVIALILNAAWSIGRKVVRSWPAILIGIAAFAAGLGHMNALWLLLVSGAAGFLLPFEPPASKRAPSTTTLAKQDFIGLISVLPFPPLPVIASTFFKVGLTFVGGGFILVPLLHNRLVTQLGWLTAQEYLDGLALSNLTPGPVAILATFAGYHLAGIMGALVATAALFTPSILLMLLISREYHRLRNDTRVQRFLAGINPAVAGLILSAAPILGRTALTTWRGYTLLALSFALLAGLRWPPAAVLAIGAIAGYFRPLS